MLKIKEISFVSFNIYHLEWRILYENRLGKLSIVWLGEVNTLSGEGLENTAMILIMIIWIRIDVRQCQAVQFCIGKCVDDLRLQMFLILKQQSNFMIITQSVDAAFPLQ